MTKTIKKTLALILSLLMLVSVMPLGMSFAVSALESDFYTYELDAEDNAIITGYTGTETNIVIPSELDGHTVLSINEPAFKNKQGLTKVTVPVTLEVIGESAFDNCVYLEEVIFGAALKEIGAGAFKGCSNLKTIWLGENIESIGNNAFINSDGLVVNYCGTQQQWERITLGNKVFEKNNKLPTINYGEHAWKDATCTDPKTCSVCGATDGEVNGHTLTYTEARPATCAEFGNLEHWYCSVCTMCFADAQGESEIKNVVIPKSEVHTETPQYISEVPADCIKDGKKQHIYCSVCKTFLDMSTNIIDEEDLVIEALGHKFIEYAENAATCTDKGNVAYKECTECSLFFAADASDKSADGVEDKSEFYTDTTHDYADEFAVDVEPGCLTVGSKSRHCSLCEATTQVTEISATGHSFNIVENAADSTCKEFGNTGCKQCQICDLYFGLNAGTNADNGVSDANSFVIDLKDHIPAEAVREKEVAAECEKPGSYDSVIYCSACNDELSREQKTVGALEHVFDDSTYIVITPAECEVEGVATKHCTICEMDINIIVPALDHEEVSAPDRAPTCEKEGYEGGTWCAVCEEYLVAPKTIPALKHDWEKTQTSATCTAAGEATYVCKNDNTHTKTEAEGALGHSYNDWDVKKAATCLKDGYKTRACTVCLYIDSEDLLALGHEFGDITEAEIPTCIATGNNAYKQCETCELYFAADDQTNSVDGVEDATSFEIAADLSNHNNRTNYNETPATCLEVGYTAGTYCGDCETWVSGHTEIPAIAHENKVPHTEVDATCVATGTVEYWACPDCEKNYSDEACETEVTNLVIEIDASNHVNTNDYVEVPADCLAGGFEAGTKCEDCGVWTSGHEVIDPLGHAFGTTVAASEATCLAAGNEAYKQCTACELYFASDAEVDAADGVENEASFVISQKDHSYTGEIKSDGNGEDATHSFKCINGCDAYGDAEAHNWNDGAVTTVSGCISEGVITYTCEDEDCGATYTASIPALNHTFGEVTAYEAPDCVNAGNEAYKYCPACEKYFAEDAALDAENGEESAEAFTISALDHDFDEDFTVDLKATCTEDGSKSKHCSRCNEKTEETVIEAREHSFIDTTVETPATCLDTGIMNQQCANDTETDEYEACDAEETRVIDANGHNFGAVTKANEATCVAKGNAAYKKCSACNKYFAGNAATNAADGKANTTSFVIPVNPSNHDLSEDVTTVTNGTEKAHYRSCTRNGCDYTQGQGHNFTGDFKEDTPATCIATGAERAYCSYCRGYVYRILPKTAHKDADKNNKCDVCNVTIQETPADPTPDMPDEGGDVVVPNCDCNCHKNGIIGLLFDFVLFFQRLFGWNKTCVCGVDHY